jgi:hypothetical protein
MSFSSHCEVLRYSSVYGTILDPPIRQAGSAKAAVTPTSHPVLYIEKRPCEDGAIHEYIMSRRKRDPRATN